MHIIIAFITVIISLLYALERFGVDVGWLNPWAWKRRRSWQKMYHANPAFSLKTPLEALALLLTAAVKVDGDFSSEEKAELLHIFENELNQTRKDAGALLVSSVFFLNNGRDVFERPEKVLAPNLEKFTDQQIDSSLKLLNDIINVGGKPTQLQNEFVKKITLTMKPKNNSQSWG